MVRLAAAAARGRKEEVSWFSGEGYWLIGLLVAGVVGRIIFLGFDLFAKRPAFKMEENGPDCEDAKKKWQ